MAATATEKKHNLYEAGILTAMAAEQHEVPQGLLWGIVTSTNLPAGKTFTEYVNEVAKTMSQTHFKTNKWDTAVTTATGGKVTDAEATAAQNKHPLQTILGNQSVEGVSDLLVAATAGAGALWLALPTAALFGGEAAAGAGVAGAGAAGAGEAGAGAAAGAEGGAAAGAAGGAAAGAGALGLGEAGLIGGITAIVSGYGLRLGEIIAGGLLILFGLVTLAKGSAPSPVKAAKAAAAVAA